LNKGGLDHIVFEVCTRSAVASSGGPFARGESKLGKEWGDDVKCKFGGDLKTHTHKDRRTNDGNLETFEDRLQRGKEERTKRGKQRKKIWEGKGAWLAATVTVGWRAGGGREYLAAGALTPFAIRQVCPIPRAAAGGEVEEVKERRNAREGSEGREGRSTDRRKTDKEENRQVEK
jgi:hypothetical protein